MSKNILFLIIIIFSSNAYAGIDKLLQYASPDGSMSNVNSPAIIKDQAGGYMTGGSIILRGPRPHDLSPINIQTPKLKYDPCTGSGDFRFGAMSYISHAEFSNFLKNVARASGAYLVKMSIKTACPQCEDIMTYLETVARDINGMSMNQCAMAQALTSGVIGKIASSDKQRCMTEANAFGSDKDMFETTSRCSQEIGQKSHKSGTEEFKSLLGDEFNLVWKALSKGTRSETNFKELMMSVSGTIIGRKENGAYNFSYKPSLLVDKDLLEQYIGSSNNTSKIRLYSCDEQDLCLKPKEVEVSLSPNQTLYGNISKIFEKSIDKVQRDDPNLSDEEKSLISFSTIPILHLIEMELGSKAHTADLIVRVPEFVEVICYDVITNYMQIMLSRILGNVKNLEHAQIDDVIIRNFTEDAEKIRHFLRDAKFSAFQKLQVIMQVKERLNNNTKEFEYRFGKMMQDIEK